MTPQKASAVDLISFHDLKTLAAAKGPCISMFLPLSDVLEIRARLKNAIRSVEKGLKNGHDDLLKPIYELADNSSAEGRWGAGLVVFRSPDLFRHYWVREFAKEMISVGDCFQLRPFLPLLRTDQRFYILTLSQKQIRLLRSTGDQLKEVPLPTSVPKTLHDDMQTTQPDHVQDNRSAGGPSIGSMKGVMFGTNSDRDSKPEYLLHFFNDIDKGVQTLLHNETAPLVLAGVESETALYRKVSGYPHLLEKALLGAPAGYKPTELQARAQALVREHFSEPLRKALAQFEKTDRVTYDLTQILQAAEEGRLSQLFLREDAEHKSQDGEDLLNRAALETLRHGGAVFVLQPDKMPERAAAAGILRY